MDEQPILINLPKTVNPNLQLPDPELVNYYRDKENRTIWMLGEVSEESFDWVDFILECNRNDKGIDPIDRKPIKCIIANYGGSLENAKMLTEIIKLSKTPVWGIAIGMCASAASMIYLACHVRFALPNAVFLFHQGGCSNLEGTYNQINAFMENYRKDIEELTNFYKVHTTYSPQVIESKLNQGDWYVYTDEGLKNGVVDEVVGDIDIFF